MKKIILIVIAASLLSAATNAELDKQRVASAKASGTVRDDRTAALAQKSVLIAPLIEEPTSEPLQPPEALEPEPWNIEAIPAGARGDLVHVNNAIEHYQDMGLTKQGTAMLVGNYLQEMPEAFVSGDPCDPDGYGDGGKALGFAQWHPGRRADAPCGFYEQLTWAVNTEMKRDSGGQVLHPLLYDSAATADQLHYGLKKWERYGVAGKRYQFGIAILNQL